MGLMFRVLGSIGKRNDLVLQAHIPRPRGGCIQRPGFLFSLTCFDYLSQIFKCSNVRRFDSNVQMFRYSNVRRFDANIQMFNDGSVPQAHNTHRWKGCIQRPRFLLSLTYLTHRRNDSEAGFGSRVSGVGIRRITQRFWFAGSQSRVEGEVAFNVRGFCSL